MKRIIICAIIFLITFSVIFLNIFSKEKNKKDIENKNISVILETEEGNLKSDTFPNKEDYEYSTLTCENTKDEVVPTFNEETWKLNLSVEEEKIDGNFNCTVHFKENTPPNPPELNGDMVPVYYDEASGVWRKADENNTSTEHKWYDYNNKMWANSVTYDHTKILDLSGKNNTGEINGAEYTSEGMNFDGVDDHIDVGYANYDFNNQLTVIARFKTREYSPTGGVIVDNYHTDGVATGFELFVGSTGRIVLQFFNKENGTNVRVSVSSEITELNTWYTAVGTYDGSTMKVYVDGELKGEKKLTPEEMNGINSRSSIWLGANPYDGGMHLYNGTVSDVILINDVLTESEIKENYNGEITHKENEKTLFSYDLQGYEGKNNGEVVPMEAISTMQVWIPRYKYKVWNYNSDGTKTSNPQQIDIKFERGTNSTGDISCTDNIQGENGDGTSEVCEVNNITCTDNLCNGSYYTHPAFTFGSEELTGFWVGKFELSGETTSPKVLPNLEGRFNARLSIISNSIMSMNDSGNTYGFTTKVDTHMIKNMEWGSIAYLTHSKYGTCNNGKCTEMGRNNNSNYITGCGSEPGSTSSTTCNEYNTTLGMRASTTGNIYGVYDMSGGSVEPTMGNVASPDGTTMMSGGASTSNSGYSGVVYDDGAYNNHIGTYSYPDKKYYDKYSFATNIDISLGKLGDATRESYSLERSWYDGNRGFAHAIYPWIARGGSASNTNSGIFFYTNSTGHSTFSVSSRFIIVP